MAMSDSFKEVVRPRRHYFWIFGLTILILIGVVLTKYDMTGGVKTSPFLMDATRPALHTQPLRRVATHQPSGNNKTRGTIAITMISRGTVKTRKNADGSFSTIKVSKEKINSRSKNLAEVTTERHHGETNSSAQRNTDVLKINAELEEVHNIVYAKVHKAASSVLQNIFLRFAVSRKLNVLFPTEGHVISESSSRIDPKHILPLPKGENYNILCNHVIFNKKEIERYFPKPTFYIGIIRHPMRQVSSALYYYATRYQKSKYPLVFKFFPRNPLHAFLSRPYLYDRDPPRQSYVNNRMSIDLGFPVSNRFEQDKKNNAKIQNFIADLDKTFHLILVVELFDESLILLRRLLNWKTVDILYRKINVRSDPDNVKVNSVDKDLHKRWAPIDYEMYTYFRNKLEKEIVRQGDDFTRELASYRKIQNSVLKFCDSDRKHEKLSVKGTIWSEGFAVTRRLCDFMSEGETSMVAKVKRKQIERLHGG